MDRVIKYTFRRDQLEWFFGKFNWVSYKEAIPSIYLSKGYLNFSSFIVNAVDMAQETSLFEDYGYRFKLKRGDIGDPMHFFMRCGDKDRVEVEFTISKRPTMYLSCLLYTSPSPRDRQKSRMPSSA